MATATRMYSLPRLRAYPKTSVLCIALREVFT